MPSPTGPGGLESGLQAFQSTSSETLWPAWASGQKRTPLWAVPTAGSDRGATQPQLSLLG